MKNTCKKIIAMSLTAVALFGSLVIPEAVPAPISEELTISASAEMVSTNIHDILFDWIYYYNAYPDLQKAFGQNPAALRKHWEQYGKREGRSPSSLFDPVFYVNKYGDIKNAYGTNYVKIYDHFVNYGIKEGRQGSKHFSVTIYKNNYKDLRDAFGTQDYNNWRYLKHWREYGLAEKRNATSNISTPSQPQPTPTPNPNPSTTTYCVKTNGSNLNVRQKASTSSSVLGKLANGTAIQVVSISNGWAKIKYGNGYGYVSANYTSKTNPTPTPNPTNNKGTALLNFAKSQVGKKYGAFSGKNFHWRAWCADFVSYCASQTGCSYAIPKNASVDGIRSAIKNKGGKEYSKASVRNGSFTPKAGDIIIFKSSGASHVGIVSHCQGGRIYYVDGNNTSAGNGNNSRVNYSNCSVSDSKFTCILRPNY